MPIRILAACLITALLSSVAAAQVAETTRDRAKPSYETGLEQMRREAFDAAATSFKAAIDIDPSFEMAHYMLGRLRLMQRHYVASVQSLARARDLFAQQATERFTNKQEADSKRREMINDMTNVIAQLQQAPQNARVQEQIRQYTERRRQLQDLDRQLGLTPDQAVPGFVSLSLGSAYFRTGKLTEAEREYRAAIAADPRMSEAHNNLAVVYMETGRLDQAEETLKAAEKAGLPVSQALKEEIKKRRQS
jgi:Tfp pilus assembly protein PilF